MIVSHATSRMPCEVLQPSRLRFQAQCESHRGCNRLQTCARQSVSRHGKLEGKGLHKRRRHCVALAASEGNPGKMSLRVNIPAFKFEEYWTSVVPELAPNSQSSKSWTPVSHWTWRCTSICCLSLFVALHNCPQLFKVTSNILKYKDHYWAWRQGQSLLWIGKLSYW